MQLLPEAAYPSQFLLEELLIKLCMAFQGLRIETHKEIPSPSNQGLDIHISCFCSLVWWSQKGESSLLNLALCLGGQAGKLLPGFVGVEFLLQDSRRLMFDVIDSAGLGMLLTKSVDPCLQIRAVIADDGSWHPRLLNGRFKLLPDNLTVGCLHRHERKRFDIFMAEAAPSRRQGTQTDTKNNETLLSTKLHGMINNPRPIVCVFLRSCEFVIS